MVYHPYVVFLSCYHLDDTTLQIDANCYINILINISLCMFQHMVPRVDNISVYNLWMPLRNTRMNYQTTVLPLLIIFVLHNYTPPFASLAKG